MQNRVTLNEVKQAFSEWRSSKLHRTEKTPKRLRKQVAAIMPYYPRREILASLAITDEQMRLYVSRSQEEQSISAQANDLASNEFIELPMPELPTIKHELTPSTSLTITRCDGASWTISQASEDVISESLRLFLRS